MPNKNKQQKTAPGGRVTAKIDVCIWASIFVKLDTWKQIGRVPLGQRYTA